jgi:hypothetical protein
MNKSNTQYQRLIGEGAPTDYFYGTYVDNVSVVTQANVADKPANIADKSTNVADKPANIADKSTNVADKPANIAYKSTNITDKPPNYRQKSKNTTRDEPFASPESPESECCCLMSLFCCCTF